MRLSHRTSFILGVTAGYTVLASLKGLAFVAVTAMGLLLLLRHVTRAAKVEPSTAAAPRRLRHLTPFLVLVAVSMVLAASGSLAYRSGAEALKQSQVSELRAVSDLKVTAISRWLQERRTNVLAFAHATAAGSVLNSWLITGAAPDSDPLLGAISSLRRTYGFTSVQIVRSAGSPLLPDGAPPL